MPQYKLGIANDDPNMMLKAIATERESFDKVREKTFFSTL